MLTVHEIGEQAQVNLVGDLAELATDVACTMTAVVKVNLTRERITCEVVSVVPFAFERDSLEPIFSALTKTVEGRVRRELCELLEC